MSPCRLEKQAPLLAKPKLEKQLKSIQQKASELMTTAVTKHMRGCMDSLRKSTVAAAQRLQLVVLLCCTALRCTVHESMPQQPACMRPLRDRQ